MTSNTVTEHNTVVRNAQHCILLIAVSIVCGAAATLSLSASYTDPTIFSHGWIGILTDVFGHIGGQGVASSTSMCIAMIVVIALMIPRFNNCDRRTQITATVVGSLIALSIVTPMYGVGPAGTYTADTSVPATISDLAYTPPAVSPADMTAAYHIYNIARWISLIPFCTLIIACLFDASQTRFTVTNMGRQESAIRVFSDDFRDLISSSWKRIWHALRFGEKLFAKLSFTRCLIMTVVILVLWSGWIALLSPVNIGPDTVAQIMWYRTGQAWDPSTRQLLPGYAMSDHHPWLETLLYGFFDKFGVSIGNEALGLWLLAFLQSVALAAALSVMLGYLGGCLHIHWHYCMVAFAFCALNPAFGRLSVTLVKDSTAMPFIIIWIVLFIEYVRRIKSNSTIGLPLMSLLFVFAILCSLTRKINVYVILVVLLLLLAFLRKRVVTLSLIVLIVAANTLIPMVAFPALHIAKGGKQEMLAVPLQQTFTVLDKYGSTMNPSHKDAINKIIVCSAQQIKEYGYAWTNANPIKDYGCFNKDATSADLGRFLLVWVEEGIAHPRTYLESVSWLGDYFKMGSVYDEGFHVRWGWPEYGASTTILPQYADNEMSAQQKIGKVLYTSASKTPIVGLAMTEVTYTVWIPLLSIGLCIVLRRLRNLIYTSPMLISLCTVLVTPRHNSRYSWVMLFCSVLLLIVPFIMQQTKKTDTTSGK